MAYLALAVLWTLYMAVETYVFARPQARPHVAGFLLLHLLLAPVSFAVSLTSGVLRERIETTYQDVVRQRIRFYQSRRKTMVG